MTPSNIISQLKTQLQNSSDLNYVDDNFIFLGVRSGITNFPCIIIEPLGDRKIADNYPYEKIILKISIVGIIKVFDDNKQIVGSDSIKGIIDFKNDIKKAISSDYTLSGNAIDVNMIDSTDVFEEYPYRSFTINLEVLYQQDRTART